MNGEAPIEGGEEVWCATYCFDSKSEKETHTEEPSFSQEELKRK